MTTPMTLSPELYWLTLTILLSAILWIPIILNRLREMGVIPAVLNPEPDEKAETRWAVRADRAHKNAVENLVLFAPLVLLIEVTSLASPATASACMIYFGARLAHYIIYLLGLPLLRTLAFATGFCIQVFLAAVVLGWA